MNHTLYVSPDIYSDLSQSPPKPFLAPDNPKLSVGDMVLVVNHKSQNERIVCEIKRIEIGERANTHHVRIADQAEGIRIMNQLHIEFTRKVAEAVFNG